MEVRTLTGMQFGASCDGLGAVLDFVQRKKMEKEYFKDWAII